MILSRLLESFLEPVFLLNQADSASQSQVSARGWRFEIFDPNRLWQWVSFPAAVLIDTRETEGTARLSEEASTLGIPVISIHDLGLNPLPSDIVIDGSISPSVEKFPRHDASFHTGTDYLVLDPVYALLHRRPKSIAGRIELLAVNLGGGDTRDSYLKVLEGLRLCNRDLEVVGTPGFAPWGQDALSRMDWQPLRFRWAKPEESIADLLFRADLAFTAGGLSIFEALCAGTPVLALSVDDLQETTVSKIAASGACINLGLEKDFRPAEVPELISSLSGNRALRQELSGRGRRILDGQGAERVASIIRGKILARLACPGMEQ